MIPPFLTVEAFYWASLAPRKTRTASFRGIFSIHIPIHRLWLVIRIWPWFSTVPRTGYPQVTGGDLLPSIPGVSAPAAELTSRIPL
jgi:hypothetical protein